MFNVSLNSKMHRNNMKNITIKMTSILKSLEKRSDLYMGFLYKGRTRIKGVTVKTKIPTDFITAGAGDILTGKKSIDKNYNSLTGTMTITDTVSSLTNDATAVAANITKDKTLWVKGNKITGTAVRGGIETLVSGLVESYKVANNNNILVGDFVKFVDEVCGCGYKTKDALSARFNIKNYSSYYIKTHLLSANKVLLLITDDNDSYKLKGCVITMDGEKTTISSMQTLDANGSSNTISIIPISGNRFVIVYAVYNGGSRAAILTVSNTNVISLTSITDISAGWEVSAIDLGNNQIAIGYINNDIFKIAYLTVSGSTLTYTNTSTMNGDIYMKKFVMTYIANNKILVMYQTQTNNSSAMIVLDISNRNSIIAGPYETVSASMFSTSFDIVKIIDNHALVAYTIYDGTNFVCMTDIVFTNGLNISRNTVTPGSVYDNVGSTSITLLTNTSAAIFFKGRYAFNICYITFNTNNLTISAGSAYEVDTSGYNVINVICYEEDKVLVVYDKYDGNFDDRRLYGKLLQRKGSSFTDVLTVYDITQPLTQRMVAKAIAGNTVVGVARNSGNGRLYGGDTIQIIRPNV